MKYFVNLVVLIFIVILCNSNGKAAEKIAYIDIEKIMRESKVGKSMNQDLKKIHLKNLENFKKFQKKIKEDELKIVSQKNILDKNEFNKKINELRSEAKEYRNQRNKDIENLNIKRLEATNKLLNAINPLIVEYSNKNSISIIFQKKNVVVGKSELDITNDILKIVDTKIKKIKIN